MEQKFYTQADVEALGFKQMVFKLKDDNGIVVEEQPINAWFKDSILGRKLFVKCSCKRFYEKKDTFAKNETYVSVEGCPFCGVRIDKLLIKK
jgi:hypothetical protein